MMAATSMGMTIIGGMFTKMMMGGVSMIAVKALFIAKVALLLAAILTMKKLMQGFSGNGNGIGTITSPSWSFSGGGGGGGGGGNEHVGYRKISGRHLDDEQSVRVVSSELAYKNQLDRGVNSVRNPQ